MCLKSCQKPHRREGERPREPKYLQEAVEVAHGYKA